MKKVWVIGVGLFGGFLVKHLITDNNIDIELIDKDREKLRIFNHLNLPMHIIDARSFEELQELGIKKNDICVLAIGDSIGASILVCQNLIDLGNQKIYVRVLNESHRKIINSMKIYETIEVHSFAGKRLASKIITGLEMFELDQNNDYAVIKIKNTKIDNISLEDTLIRKKTDSNVLLIKRKNEWIIPDADTKIQINDLVYIFIPNSSQKAVIQIMGNTI